MKEPITKFNFEDAFKALDDIPVPAVEKGIRANRQDLQETMRRVDKFELLFEDFYDVNDSEDMNAASEEREAEVAKAKLARIEKIVDLDAETEEDILPSYVGKIIIQCPQCMTLFYKNPEDIEKDEENPDVVNVNEACQHCGNTSGYDIIGKVAEEEAPAEEATDVDLGGDELGNDENDLSVEDTTEEGTDETSNEGEVDELSAEVDLDELDLEEIPDEETEEEKNESLHNSKALKDAEEESDLKTENESKKLTLNEDIDDDLDAKLKAHDEYIAHLRTTIEQEEKALEAEKNEQIKTSIQGRIDTLKAELEAALPDAVKAEAPVEDTEVAEEETIETEETVEETTEEVPVEENETEETTESLREAVESMTDTLNRAWEVAKKTNSPIGVTVITPVGAGTTGKLKEWSHNLNANLYYVDAKNPDLMANGFDEDMISRPNTIIVIDEFDRAPANTQKAISKEIDYLDAQVEMVIAISHDNNINGDNFKRFKQYVANIETEVKEALNKDLTEANTIPSASEANINKLFNSDEFKKPVSDEEVKSFFEAVEDEEDLKSKLSDIDETSFNKQITESLTAVYKNVKDFTMTDCSLDNKTLVIEGVITFNSGKTRNTNYIFEAKTTYPTNKLEFIGTNKDLFKNGNIKVSCDILSETLYASNLAYKYNIGEQLVEGTIKRTATALTENVEDAEVSVEGDDQPVKLDVATTNDTEDAVILAEAGGWGALNKPEQAIAKILKNKKYAYLYLVPTVSGTSMQGFFKANRSFDSGANYNAKQGRFMVLEAGNGNSYPVQIPMAGVNEKSEKEIIAKVKELVLPKIKLMSKLTKVTAATVVDLLGGSALNPKGKVWDTSNASKPIKMENILLIGSKTPLVAIDPTDNIIPANEADSVFAVVSNSQNTIVKQTNSDFVANKELLAVAKANTDATSTDDETNNEANKSAIILKYISKLLSDSNINTVVVYNDEKKTAVEVGGKKLLSPKEYLENRDNLIANTNDKTHVVAGYKELFVNEGETEPKEYSDELSKYIIETIQGGRVISVNKDYKTPEKPVEEPKEATPKGTEEEVVTSEAVAPEQEPEIAKKLQEKGLKLIPVALGKDNKVAPLDIGTDDLDLEKCRDLCKKGHDSGNDTAIVVVAESVASALRADASYKELTDREKAILEVYKDDKRQEEHYKDIMTTHDITLEAPKDEKPGEGGSDK